MRIIGCLHGWVDSVFSFYSMRFGGKVGARGVDSVAANGAQVGER